MKIIKGDSISRCVAMAGGKEAPLFYFLYEEAFIYSMRPLSIHMLLSSHVEACLACHYLSLDLSPYRKLLGFPFPSLYSKPLCLSLLDYKEKEITNDMNMKRYIEDRYWLMDTGEAAYYLAKELGYGERYALTLQGLMYE